MSGEIKNIGSIEFWLRDNRDLPYNGSVDCTFELYGTEKGRAISIEQYWDLCRAFAAAMGFSEQTIAEYF